MFICVLVQCFSMLCLNCTAVYIPLVIQSQMSFSQFVMLKAFFSATTAGKISYPIATTCTNITILQWILPDSFRAICVNQLGIETKLLLRYSYSHHA